MKQQERSQFDDRLLVELKKIVVTKRDMWRTNVPATPPPPRGTRTRRVAVFGALGMAIATALVVLPTVRGESGSGAAYAVTENNDGTVTVEIRSIQDDDGLERQLEEAGVSASVHYLPQDKLCGWMGRDLERYTLPEQSLAERMNPHAGERQPITIGERGDAFTFTVDRSQLSSGQSIVVVAEDDAPEHGQKAATVASIATFVLQGGNFDECPLVDGSIESWGFQEGAALGTKN